MTFKEWMKEVDREVQEFCGVGVDDLPDCCFRDEYDAGSTPLDMAYLVLEQAGFTDFPEC